MAACRGLRPHTKASMDGVTSTHPYAFDVGIDFLTSTEVYEALICFLRPDIVTTQAAEHSVDIQGDPMQLKCPDGDPGSSEKGRVYEEARVGNRAQLLRTISLALLPVEYVVYPVVSLLFASFTTHTSIHFYWTVLPLAAVWYFLRLSGTELWHRRIIMLALSLMMFFVAGYCHFNYLLVPDVTNKVGLCRFFFSFVLTQTRLVNR